MEAQGFKMLGVRISGKTSRRRFYPSSNTAFNWYKRKATQYTTNIIRHATPTTKLLDHKRYAFLIDLVCTEGDAGEMFLKVKDTLRVDDHRRIGLKCPSCGSLFQRSPKAMTYYHKVTCHECAPFTFYTLLDADRPTSVAAVGLSTSLLPATASAERMHPDIPKPVRVSCVDCNSTFSTTVRCITQSNPMVVEARLQQAHKRCPQCRLLANGLTHGSLTQMLRAS